MSFFKKGLFQKTSSSVPLVVPLAQGIPNYTVRINAHVNLLEDVLEMLQTQMDTSLDVLLKRGIGNLRSSVIEYTRMLEQILFVRHVLDPSAAGARKRGVGEIVRLASEELRFYGGERVILAAQFLDHMTHGYLAQIEESEFAKHVQSVKHDFEILKLFISKN